ncbi:hypothetical protein BMS3Bbin05_00452 [bacterium BMS3Bbin05]|nr:hypothetical protein BMS3Bbin05_00452 [bacterium BMS3Bbin05]
MRGIKEIGDIYDSADSHYCRQRPCYCQMQKRCKLFLRTVPPVYVVGCLFIHKGLCCFSFVALRALRGILRHYPDYGQVSRYHGVVHCLYAIGAYEFYCKVIIFSHRQSVFSHCRPLSIYLQHRPQPHEIGRGVVQPSVRINDILVLHCLRLISYYHLFVREFKSVQFNVQELCVVGISCGKPHFMDEFSRYLCILMCYPLLVKLHTCGKDVHDLGEQCPHFQEIIVYELRVAGFEFCIDMRPQVLKRCLCLHCAEVFVFYVCKGS